MPVVAGSGRVAMISMLYVAGGSAIHILNKRNPKLNVAALIV